MNGRIVVKERIEMFVNRPRQPFGNQLCEFEDPLIELEHHATARIGDNPLFRVIIKGPTGH